MFRLRWVGRRHFFCVYGLNFHIFWSVNFFFFLNQEFLLCVKMISQLLGRDLESGGNGIVGPCCIENMLGMFDYFLQRVFNIAQPFCASQSKKLTFNFMLLCSIYWYCNSSNYNLLYHMCYKTYIDPPWRMANTACKNSAIFLLPGYYKQFTGARGTFLMVYTRH